MKKFFFVFAFIGMLIFTACDNNQKSTEEAEVIQAEIGQLEEATELIEENTKDLESSLEDLGASLDSLDILFPEEDQN